MAKKRQTVTIAIECQYDDEAEFELFCQQLQRFLNNSMTFVDWSTDDLPYRKKES